MAGRRVMRDEPLTRLADAKPRWSGARLVFECPIHTSVGSDENPFPCVHMIPVNPPPDGSPPVTEGITWRRTGASEEFETLSLSPSIAMGRSQPDRPDFHHCKWHGFIRNGRFEHCGDAR